MSLTIACVATNTNHAGYQALQLSNKTRFALQTFGKDVQWSALPYKWRWRMQKYIQAADSCETEWLLLCDAYDVLLHPQAQARLEELIDKLGSQNVDVLIGVEKSCGRNCRPLSRFCTEQDVFVNGGVVLGKPKHVRAMYAWILAQFPIISDDQIGLSMYLDKTLPLNIQLDKACDLVTNVTWLTNTASLQFVHASKSALFHFPGWLPAAGWSRLYNACISSWASPRLAPPFQIIPQGLRQAILSTSSVHYPIFKFLLQLTAAWLGLSIVRYNRLHWKMVSAWVFVVSVVLHNYLTFT